MKSMLKTALNSMIILTVFLSVLTGVSCFVLGQSVDPNAPIPSLPPGVSDTDMERRSVPDQRVRSWIVPKRVLWQSATGIKSEKLLLQKPLGLTSTAAMKDGFTMSYPKTKGSLPPSILLDFGAEIQGGIRLESRSLTVAPASLGRTVRVHVRFGESADEAMAVMGEKGACNDHSVRDTILSVPFLGGAELGQTAFRFVRLDLIDPGTEICFDYVRAYFCWRDIPWLGSFKSSDKRLDAIWKTAAYTQHLTMQDFNFEGAKRDRLVWYGDFHPQTMTTLYVFGTPKVLADTLGEYAQKTWPLPKWMNTMPNYSLWWIISVGDYYMFSGDKDFARHQLNYMKNLFELLKPCVDSDGCAAFRKNKMFLDWPTNDKPNAIAAGTHAMFALAFDRVALIARELGETKLEHEATELAKRVRSFKSNHVQNKQAAALLALAGIERPEAPNIEVVARNNGENFSTFYGYYMLEALAKGGRNQTALNVIRQYWGAMLDVGATTFWEDFDLKWLEGSGRIDEITPPGKKSLHGDHGAYCYVGFRHSLCHGWASGPAPWMSAHLLGVQPVEPGFRKVRISPFLGDLDWVEGTVPTPRGLIKVRHDKNKDGSIRSKVELPPGVEQVR
ncbi:MAG: alpha-L-rhamnosidase C-terminal domain-containing protein [Thermoguttaceae bacterium]|nr:alpha-L-rhamnosidase C-terminal domain-containing protein [Thermoguttaceae bacterium]